MANPIAMPRVPIPAEACFLNRLALFTREDPLKADVQEIFRSFYDIETPAAINSRLLRYCSLAAAGDPLPANLNPAMVTGFFHKLEILIEIAWLLHAKIVTAGPLQEKGFVSGILSVHEHLQPSLVFKEFFGYKTLGEWKELTDSWCDSCLSGNSIADLIDAQDILLSFVY